MCDASAFLVISAGAGMTEESFTCFDDTDPAFFGKDYIQRPLMVAIGGNDFITDNNGHLPSEATVPPFDPSETDWMFPVTNAVGLNNAPAYGVVIDGANHFTPISEFHGMASWDFGTFWDWFGGVLTIFNGVKSINLDKQACTEDDDELLKNSIADTVIDFLKGMFPQLPVTTENAERPRLDTFEKYTKYFWDVYLTSAYDDAAGGVARAFLQKPDSDHMTDPLVLTDYGFAHSSPGAFVIRDASGKDLVQFQNDGRLLLLTGTEHTNANITQTSAAEFIIRNASGTIAAKVDTSTGDLYLRGSLTKVADLETTSASEFVIRDAVEIAQQGNENKAKFVLDASGNLKTRGDKLVLNPPQ